MDVAVIEEVIGEFVHLKKSGYEFQGIKPIYQRKNTFFFRGPA